MAVRTPSKLQASCLAPCTWSPARILRVRANDSARRTADTTDSALAELHSSGQHQCRRSFVYVHSVRNGRENSEDRARRVGARYQSSNFPPELVFVLRDLSATHASQHIVISIALQLADGARLPRENHRHRHPDPHRGKVDVDQRSASTGPPPIPPSPSPPRGARCLLSQGTRARTD